MSGRVYSAVLCHHAVVDSVGVFVSMHSGVYMLDGVIQCCVYVTVFMDVVSYQVCSV